MFNKNIVAIVLIGLLVFHKQLNLNFEYLAMIACLLCVLSTLNTIEGFNGDDVIQAGTNADEGESAPVAVTRQMPEDSATRRDSYTINRNINSPSNIGFSNDPVRGEGLDGLAGNQGQGLGYGYGRATHLTDESGNIWTTSNLGVDGDARVKGSLTVDIDQTVKGKFDVDNEATMHNNLYVMKDTINTGKFRSKDDGVFERDLTVMGTGNFDTTVNINGDAFLKKNLDVLGGARVAGDVRVDGGQVISGNLGVNGMSSLTGNAEITDDLMVSRDTVVGGNLSVLSSVGQGFDKSTFVQMTDNGWGDVIDKRCPDNHFMCGMRIRHEFYDPETKQDNSGVNGVSIQCCPFK